MTDTKKDSLDNTQKWVVSLYCLILFLLIASPFMYKLTNSLTSLVGWETSENGCPNLGGLVLHAIVFGLLIRLLMLIPKSYV